MDSHKVLVVEDSPTMTQLLVLTLKKIKEVEVVTASDGVDGLKKLGEQSYDLVLTDINMPLMDGLKFVSLIRGGDDGSNKDVPIVIITTEGEDAVRDKGLELGANSYITKPINPRVVTETVRKYLKS